MKTLTLQIRKGLNSELDKTIQPGGYKEIEIFEAIIDGEVVESSQVCDHHISIMQVHKETLYKALNYIKNGRYE